MGKIITDATIEKLDLQLGDFLSSEYQMFKTLVERRTITSELMFDIAHKSVEHLVQAMQDDEVFALLAAIARRIRRYRTYDDPFRQAMDNEVGTLLMDVDTEIDATGFTRILRIYAEHALFSILDQNLGELYNELQAATKSQEAA